MSFYVVQADPFVLVGNTAPLVMVHQYRPATSD
jgi:hypothetical protein